MTLSNTAVPTYYGQFREKVMRGEIPVSQQIVMEMNRIDALIANSAFYYDDKAIDGFIAFCEGELTLTNGDRVELLESFKLWAEAALSWFYFDVKSFKEPHPSGHGFQFVTRKRKRRLVRKQYLIVARGGAKSMYASFMQAYFLTIDPETTHQVTTAPTMTQALEVMSPLATALARAPGPYFQFLTDGSLNNTTGNKINRQKLASTKKGIQNFMTNSILEVRPMSKDKLQGLRVKIATVDEWLSGDVRDNVIGALEQGASKGDNEYLIIAISSEGTVRNGIGDTIKLELMDILTGEYNAPQTSIWWYKLDNVDEVKNPEMWPKAQPNLGLTVPWETYHLDYERMSKVPSEVNDILAKRFGIPAEGYTYFFTYEETLPKPTRGFYGMPCAMGADLSQGDDFTAFTFLFPLPGGNFGIKTRSYISSKTYAKLATAAALKYQEFIDEGSLMVLEGTILDMNEVYDDLEAFIEREQFNVLCMGYDPYGSKPFVESWEQGQGPYGVMKVPQGARTESIPLGELKKLAENNQLLFDQHLMSFAMGNAMTIEDTNGNRKLWKKRQSEKIDNVSALVDAWVAYKYYKESFE